ncbi:hypothetical protein [Sporanaerobacter acetigenes]|uniref:Type I restriction enzyme R protein N terminus (HSDR_N) n=1 Tax=Sporanaerobacter acetigenes DSM 13106 TaxID=1123281 RepID=A0A1M5STQ4_9FIRM|nr:hypothetical protein [Sporanaerobacter acetigenes]SHH41618.1 hypothetical protein SAMN02745180_00269 [Sporanaerobacter acetigenes DSM 13106]
MIPKDNVESKIKEALNMLIERDKELLEIDINERTLCHRLAIYIEQLFDGYDVDCEYNRSGLGDPKKLTFESIEKIYKNGEKVRMNVKDTIAKTVYPDIIVHKRKKEENLLVIEVKKSTNKMDRNIDVKKLEKYKQELKYEYAIFLLINVGESFDENGYFYNLQFIL